MNHFDCVIVDFGMEINNILHYVRTLSVSITFICKSFKNRKAILRWAFVSCFEASSIKIYITRQCNIGKFTHKR